MKKIKYDFILIFALLVLSGIIIFFMNNKKTGNSVQVYKNNELIATYPLDADNEYKIKNGNEYNILKIENGKAKIIKASCNNQICVHHKCVCKDGEEIICVPNNIIIRIVSNEKGDVDAVAK